MSSNDSRIDFFQQIKEFDYLCLTDSLPGITGNYRSVYFALLSINNSKFWSPIFEVDHQYILDLSRIDKETYRRAMEFLNENGLFDSYEKGINKYARAKVSLKVLHEKSCGNKGGNKVGNITGNAVDNTDSVEVSNEHYNKTVNIKTIKLKKQETSIDQLDFVAPEFLQLFTTWLNYKKDRRESYKTQASLQQCYKNLIADSGNSVDVARQMVERAIGSNYAGLFALKSGNSKPTEKANKVSDLLEQNERLKNYFNNAA